MKLMLPSKEHHNTGIIHLEYNKRVSRNAIYNVDPITSSNIAHKNSPWILSSGLVTFTRAFKATGISDFSEL